MVKRNSATKPFRWWVTIQYYGQESVTSEILTFKKAKAFTTALVVEATYSSIGEVFRLDSYAIGNYLHILVRRGDGKTPWAIIKQRPKPPLIIRVCQHIVNFFYLMVRK